MEWKQRMTEYNDKVKERLDNKNFMISLNGDQPLHSLSVTDLDQEFDNEFKSASDMQMENNSPTGENDKIDSEPTVDSYDPYLNMEVGMPRGDDDNLVHATVKRRVTDEEGNPIGKANKNPILDNRLYEVEFIDGTTEQITANIIAENIMSQVDAEGN